MSFAIGLLMTGAYILKGIGQTLHGPVNRQWIGLPDMTGAELLARLKQEVQFERFGFLPVATPTMELKDVLLTKTGGETERQARP